MNKQEHDAEQILKTRKAYEECRTIVTESELEFYFRFKFRFIFVYCTIIALCIGGMILFSSLQKDIHPVATILIPILVLGSVQNTVTTSRLKAQINALHKMRELEKANQWLDPTVKTPVD